MCVCVSVCVCVVSVIVKRPVLPPCVVDGHSRNPQHSHLLSFAMVTEPNRLHYDRFHHHLGGCFLQHRQNTQKEGAVCFAQCCNYCEINK